MRVSCFYRTGKGNAVRFPILGDKDLKAGIKRNFEIFDPCEFLAEVTQHIPDRGEHQVRYYGLCVATHNMAGTLTKCGDKGQSGKPAKNPKTRK